MRSRRMSSTVARVLIPFVMCLAVATSPAEAKRIALVVGNDAYTQLPALQRAAADARAVGATLTSDLGFEVIVVENQDRRAMNLALARLEKSIAPGDEVFFFFAGHGVAVGSENFLLPVDMPMPDPGEEGLVRNEGHSADAVLRAIRARGAATVFMVLDSCRNNPFAERGTRDIGFARGLARMDPPTGVFVLFSAGIGQQALDRLSASDSDPNSVFTRKFLPLLRTPGLSHVTMAKKLQEEVASLARSAGYTQEPAYYDQIIGTVVLKEGPAQSLAPESPEPSPVIMTDGGAAERAWTRVESSNDLAALEAFRRQYGTANPFYDQLAMSRIADIKTKKAEGERVALLTAEEDRKRAEAERQRRTAALVTKDDGRRATNDAPTSAWTMTAGNYAGHRYSALDQINTGNVGSLRPAWQFSTGVLRGHEGNPLVVGGMMYFVTPFPNRVFALDLARNGEVLWLYEPKQDPSTVSVMCCDTVNRGVAYSDGKIFLYQANTRLVALDAKTGKEHWIAINGDPRRGETGTNAPMVVKDKVIVGLSGGEFGVRGYITAYDIDDGKMVWRAYTTGSDSDILFDPQKTMSLGKPVGPYSSLKTWTGDQWKIGGGTAWGWFSYDPELDLIYYGTGNPSTWNPAQRAGPDGRPIDQKWTDSIIARNPDTGVAAWAYQITPFDEWNYDGVNEMILADIVVRGEPRQALVHFDKNGFAYTLDRKTGEPLVAEKFDPSVNWASRIVLDPRNPQYGRPQVVDRYSPFLNGPDVTTKGICPSSAGAKNQGPAAYSPRTGLFYAGTNHLCMDYEPFKVFYSAGQPYVGATLSMFPPEGDSHMGQFIAWNAGSGKTAWVLKEKFAVWGGALVTAGDVVFYGTLDGHLRAADAKSGKILYSYKTPSGIVGNVMTFAHAGKQYIAVLSGVGGWAGIGLAAGLTHPTDGLGIVGANAELARYTALGGQLMVFALP